MTLLRRFKSSPGSRLPDAVYAELVDMLFSTLVPVVVMGITAALIAVLAGVVSHDPAFGVLTGAALAVSTGRTVAIAIYRHQRPTDGQTWLPIRRWEGWYALGSLAFATVLGFLSARVLMLDDSGLAMLATGMIFGYGSGLVSRSAVRPVICVLCMLLAVVPTVAALAMHFTDAGSHSALAYMAQALLIGSFAFASLETVRHHYRTTLRQCLARRDLATLATQDPLTGLPNRLLLRDRVEGDVARVRQTGGLVALLVLDLDRFKAVNDGFGHPMGDALLQAVADRMRRTVPAGDMVVRLGGDEFVIVQVGLHHADEARMMAHRVIRVVSAPYRLGEHEIKIGVSVGIALAPRDGMSKDTLMARADAALYQAKRGGRGRVVFAGDRPGPEERSAAVEC